MTLLLFSPRSPSLSLSLPSRAGARPTGLYDELLVSPFADEFFSLRSHPGNVSDLFMSAPRTDWLGSLCSVITSTIVNRVVCSTLLVRGPGLTTSKAIRFRAAPGKTRHTERERGIHFQRIHACFYDRRDESFRDGERKFRGGYARVLRADSGDTREMYKIVSYARSTRQTGFIARPTLLDRAINTNSLSAHVR